MCSGGCWYCDLVFIYSTACHRGRRRWWLLRCHGCRRAGCVVGLTTATQTRSDGAGFEVGKEDDRCAFLQKLNFFVERCGNCDGSMVCRTTSGYNIQAIPGLAPSNSAHYQLQELQQQLQRQQDEDVQRQLQFQDEAMLFPAASAEQLGYPPGVMSTGLVTAAPLFRFQDSAQKVHPVVQLSST